MRCTSYSLAGDFDLKSLAEHYAKKHKTKLYDDALRISLGEAQEVFIVYGTLIFWNTNKRDESYFVRGMKGVMNLAKHPVDKVLVDDFTFEYSDKETFGQDKISIIQNDNTELSKLAVSFGIAQSAKLRLFEDHLFQAIDKYEAVVQQMAKKGVIPLSYKDVSKKLGQLFLIRNQINLESDLLDTPTFVWNYPNHEQLYQITIKDLSITTRTSVLNKRLDIMQDLFDILNNQLLAIHSSRLEWIIIWLISIEIFISLIALFFYK